MSFSPPASALLMIALVAGVWSPAGITEAQMMGDVARNEFELSDSVQLDRADNAVLTNLERVKAFLADRQWDEAIETLRQVMESSGGMLIGVTPQRYVTVRDYCQLRLAALPREALARYRQRTDPLVRKGYEDGMRDLNRQDLLNVVDQAFASSWGDQALLALGELALSGGDATTARWYWQRILPVEPALAETWPAFPDSKLDPAMVRARLVLASILEGSTARARDELAQFDRLHLMARGTLGGEEVNYSQALHALLEETAAAPSPAENPDWPTFAGSPERNRSGPKMPPGNIDPRGVTWRLALRHPASTQAPRSPSVTPRVADDARQPLSFFPVLSGPLALACNAQDVLAVDTSTGQPAWPEATTTIYRDEIDESISTAEPPNTLGIPRYTLTVHRGKLFARLGSTVTEQPQIPAMHVHPGSLVGLDLQAQGRLLWKIAPEEGWAFDGVPLADDANVYVAMRRSDVRPQAHVAAYDIETGRLRWRRFVCAAETPARAMYYQSTNNLLTLAHDTLYFNTNLGAVAALSTHDGQIRWVSLYPRARRGEVAHLALHWQRELTPCLYHRGTLLVAPADSPRIFALDSTNGQILWQTGSEVEDVVHLLGVADDTLIASGHRLYWIQLAEPGQGRVRRIWPEGSEKLGYGRGLLCGGSVYWPTRSKIYRLDVKTALPVQVIDLAPRNLTGGNLLLCGGQLLIATPTELVALGPHAAETKPAQPPLAQK
jgi:hypothetical protein